MPTKLKIVPRLLSFAAAALVLSAAVNADAQQAKTNSVVIPPIPPGQARIWIYQGPQATDPFNYPDMQAITVNGVNVAYSTLGSALYRDVPPGHTSLPPPASRILMPAKRLMSTSLPGSRHT